MQNNTNIQMSRYDAGTRLFQTRSSVTEAGWRFSPDLSVGGRAGLDRFSDGENKDEFQLSIRTRQKPRSYLRSELNFLSGLLDLSSATQVKRGASGDLNGTVRMQSRYVTHDLSGQINGNLSRTRAPETPNSVGTSDLSNNLRGTLGILAGMPVGLNLNYNLRRTRVETPTVSGTIQQLRTSNNGVDATLRLRLDNDRYLNVTGRTGSVDVAQPGVALNSQSSHRVERSFGLDGRYLLLGWNLEGRFSVGKTRSEYPKRDTSGGYGEQLRAPSIDATISRNLTRRLLLRATGNVGLSAHRYSIIGSYQNPQANHDEYHQNYRLDTQYNLSTRFNTGLALEVTRNVIVYIPAKSTANNTETRSYQVDWRWNYVMMTGLTASQSNSIGAEYTHHNFVSGIDRLSLDYHTATTLNAVLSPRFMIVIRHDARHQPAGTYAQLADGLYYLSRSEATDRYALSAQLTYTPSPAFSLSITPDFGADERDGSQSGALVPTSATRRLFFRGGANLNLPLGSKGRLTGDVGRTYAADRAIKYTNGVVSESLSRSGGDFWNGSLQISWEL